MLIVFTCVLRKKQGGDRRRKGTMCPVSVGDRDSHRGAAEPPVRRGALGAAPGGGAGGWGSSIRGTVRSSGGFFQGRHLCQERHRSCRGRGSAMALRPFPLILTFRDKKKVLLSKQKNSKFGRKPNEPRDSCSFSVQTPSHLPLLLLRGYFAQCASQRMEPLVPLCHLHSFPEADLGEKSLKSHQ